MPTAGPTDYRVLGIAPMLDVRWAPDGQHVAVWLPADDQGKLPDASWLIFDRAGTQQATVPGFAFEWTGPDTYVVASFDAGGTAHDFSGQLGSAVESPISFPLDLYPDKPCVATDSDGAYTVWLNGKESPGRNGHVMACSADNALVAIINLADGEGVTGYLEVVRVDSGVVRWSAPRVRLSAASPVVFRADGRYLLAGESIFDLRSGSVASLPVASVRSGAWLPDGRVAVIGYDDGRVRAFDGTGKESSIDLPAGNYVSVSPSGMVVVMDNSGLHVVSSATEKTILLPGVWPDLVYWSPDGHALVARCEEATGKTEAVLIEAP